MIYVPASVDAEKARAFFRRRRWGNLFGALGLEPPTQEKKRGVVTQLPCMERVWVPHYQIDFQVFSRKGPGVVSVSVEACSGCFAIFQMHDALVEGEKEEETLPLLLDEKDAVMQGRKQLLQTIMRRRGQQGKPVIENTLATAVFYYPFWVCYFKRRGKFIDVKLQDAVSAERGGNRTKQGILNAFVAKRRNPTS
ncbi:MAG TPA: hypothetical protein ENN29_12745 [Candidatus Hydrogenedentes bacterium]|nr:hypothetical protein [Candidatus Hydrogenedentota bacterium]